ncbi:MAG: BON domain-containing protein, partial [Pseudomonadota bacterium]
TETSDQWLESQVTTALFFHNNVSRSTEVTASNGTIMLSGSANSQAEKELTTEYAADVEGVKEVKNRMLVLATPKNPRTLGDKIDDTSITAAVKMILLSHRSTSALRTKVDTRDGVVNLTGEAKNDAEISLVSKLVSDANGVSRVNNAMTVKRVN